MSLDRPTLFILGAGSSYPYGLPLGAELTEEVARKVVRLGRDPQNIVVGRDFEGENFARIKDNLASTIRLSRSPTIDTFLSNLQGDKRLVTSAAANAIWEREDAFLNELDKEIPFDVKTPSLYEQDDWLAWLYHNRLYKKPDDFHKNNFAIISYNYDRIPTALLTIMMANAFQYSATKCLEIVETPLDELGTRFLHPHGNLPGHLQPVEASQSKGATVTTNYKNNYTNDAEELMFTMHDSDRIASVQHEIDKRVEWAEQIFFLGLGYHEEILRCYKPEKFANINHFDRLKKRIYGTAYRLDNDTRNSVIKRFTPDGSNSMTGRIPRIELGGENERCISLLARYMQND